MSTGDAGSPSEAIGPHRCARPAPGGPGLLPNWTGSAKDAVGTSAGTASRVWFTIAGGVVTEVYSPTVDRPQIRDLQYLATDGDTFFHEERRDLVATVEPLSETAMGFRVVSEDRGGRYRLVKEILTDPDRPSLLVRTHVEVAPGVGRSLHLFALLAPHLGGLGSGNSGYAVQVAGRLVLVARRGDAWLALGGNPAFVRGGAGYVGVNDGWTDLSRDHRLDWTYDCAHDGNIALTGEIDPGAGPEHVLGLAFGDSQEAAVEALLASLAVPFSAHRAKFLAQWDRALVTRLPLEGASGDGGALYRRSLGVLLAHEDKTRTGAIVASLSIPWGDDKGDDAPGGYHLVWPRDLVHSATGLLAAGDRVTPLRSLAYLAATQLPDGAWPQNFWVNGEVAAGGIQLDETAFPILLAWHLRRLDALDEFDPYPMVLWAARSLARAGPASPQERWEEVCGISPSTLAVTIAALTCAALWAAERGDAAAAASLQAVADDLEANVERWTVTTRGTLLRGVPRHYIRILPCQQGGADAIGDPDTAELWLTNQAPGLDAKVLARDVVDAGFLELVRYGIRAPDDPLVEASLRVVDASLRVETPFGPCWHRYTRDGYGEPEEGGPFRRHGIGRAWPILTGERAHHELAAGRDVEAYLRTFERLASGAGMLPEQVWDREDRPELGMRFGRPTGAAMPLAWAHAEYVKLLRSKTDGAVFDLIPEVAARYASRR